MKARQRQRKNEATIYRQIERDMREKIEQGIWRPETPIPSRSQLVKEYGVGLPTIERAIDLLIADELLYAQRGRGGGTFVSLHASSLLFSHSTVSPIETSSSQATPHSLATAQSVVKGQTEEGFTLQADTVVGAKRKKTSGFVLGNVAADFPIDPDKSGADADWSPIVLRSLEQTFSSAGGITTFLQRFDGEQSICSLEKALLTLLRSRVDAIAIVNVVDAYQVAQRVLQVIDTSKIPVILHTWNQPTTLLPCIAYDNVQAGYLAAKHVLNRGYQPLIFLNCRDAWWVQARFYGARAALRDLHYPAELLKVYTQQAQREEMEIGEFTHDYTLNTSIGYTAGKEVLAHEDWILQLKDSTSAKPAIIAPNDWIAYGLLRALHEADLQPGRDIGIVGFDDRFESRNIGLTSLVPPLAELGKEGAQMLLKRLHGEVSAQQVYLPSQLVARTSTLLGTQETEANTTNRTVSA